MMDDNGVSHRMQMFVTKEDKGSVRTDVIDEAHGLISNDRNNQYGPPNQDFERTAQAANAYGYRGPGGRLLASHDVAVLTSLVKLSRITWQPGKRDNWVDLAGYAACGYECVVIETTGIEGLDGSNID